VRDAGQKLRDEAEAERDRQQDAESCDYVRRFRRLVIFVAIGANARAQG
jgi:hypothetical protein